MKSALFVAALAASASAEFNVQSTEMKDLFSTWKTLNNKSYSVAEETKKFTVFAENFLRVAKHNNQNSGLKLALNQFADMTDEEFRTNYANGLSKLDDFELLVEELHTPVKVDYSVLQVPETVDWREKGAVTPVKNQAKCGSCWAFSATGALEGLNFIKSGKLLSFSEQHLVDCEKRSHGCSGGLMTNAFDYTAKQGIQLEADYPYTAKDETCKFDAKKAQHVNKAYKNVAKRNVDALKVAIATQPVAVAVQADQAAFRFYKSGIIKADCGTKLNHGVLAVGYTVVNGEEAIIIKNSWSDAWGTKGYTLLSTDKKVNGGAGVCGVFLDPSVPTA